MNNTAQKERVALRAHHLLCLHGFRGMGYDEHFVENMTLICRRVKSQANLEILVTDEADDICASCPRRRETGCERDLPGAKGSARDLDHRVMKRLGIDSGQAFSRDEILSLVLEKISPDDLIVICEGCEWLPFEYCVEGLKQRSLESGP
jgi:hypothetical protein